MLISAVTIRQLTAISTGSDRLHLRTQAIDEELRMERQWRTPLDRDERVEERRLDDAQQLDARHAAMCHGELIDDGDPKPGLDQRADRSAEARLDGDVIGELMAGKDTRHDAAVGIVRVDADQRMTGHLGGGDLVA